MKTTHRRILNYVNRLRAKELALPPLDALPRGIKDSSEHCPIAVALDGRALVDGDTVEFDSGLILDAPQVLTVWIRRFDNGCYPELVA